MAAVPPDEARWRPPGGGWSILEIVSHLADEEVDDFRTRLRITLEGGAEPWPPVDPEGWAIKRSYNDGVLTEVVARFASERAKSIKWLQGQNNADWSLRYDHPKLGAIRAGDLLVAWAAHDALHLRQIAKRLYQLTCRDGGEFRPDYAGQWTA